jgi:hypothetical protein
MAKRKRRPGKTSDTDVAGKEAPASDDTQIGSSNLSLHDLFQQQVRGMLDGTDLDEEAKQGILIAAACPCCGAGGMSFTAKIKRRT